MNFSVYRCPDPVNVNTNTPWYRDSNICPCSPETSNITGRGFTPCAYGVEFNETSPIQLQGTAGKTNTPLTGSFYQDHQFVPPQLQPRPLSRVGNQWRSSN